MLIGVLWPQDSARAILNNSDTRFRNDGKWMQFSSDCLSAMDTTVQSWARVCGNINIQLGHRELVHASSLDRHAAELSSGIAINSFLTTRVAGSTGIMGSECCFSPVNFCAWGKSYGDSALQDARAAKSALLLRPLARLSC